MRRRLLLYRTGNTAPEVVSSVGNYREWFARVVADRVELRAHFAAAEPRPDTAGCDGVLITGSPLSLVEPAPWMEEAAAFVRWAADTGLPVLGVCFGHQLIASAFGGSVRLNPQGWEAGTNEVELTAEGFRDPLFCGLPRRLRVNQSHRDEVEALGPRTVRLAGSAHSAIQAIAVGDHVRGVQFHPEMDGAVIRRVIENRRLLLTDDAHRTGRGASAAAELLLARASDTPEAERVLLNFIEHFVTRA